MSAYDDATDGLDIWWGKFVVYWCSVLTYCLYGHSGLFEDPGAGLVTSSGDSRSSRLDETSTVSGSCDD